MNEVRHVLADAITANQATIRWVRVARLRPVSITRTGDFDGTFQLYASNEQVTPGTTPASYPKLFGDAQAGEPCVDFLDACLEWVGYTYTGHTTGSATCVVIAG